MIDQSRLGKGLVQDVKKKLGKKVEFNLSEKGVFSNIYELSGKSKTYILKIDLGDRDLGKEFEILKKLNRKKISVIKPVVYSKKHHYLITQKIEDLSSLDEIMSKGVSKEELNGYLLYFGRELKKIKKIGEEKAVFDAKPFLDEIKKKFNENEGFFEREKEKIIKHLNKMAGRLDKKEHTGCLISDFHTCNIMFQDKKKSRLYLLDFTDVNQGNEYENIALVYLDCKYKCKFPTEDIFAAFLEGYGLKKIDKDFMNIFIIKHIIDYIHHTRAKRKESNILRKMIYTSDITKYRTYLNKLISS